MEKADQIFMREALVEAKKAFALKEVPVGAVLVSNGEIVARSHNLVELKEDASMHAELGCLREGAKLKGGWRLKTETLYCTLEPCLMCAGAMILFRLKKLVCGAPDLRHGAIDYLITPHPIHCVEVKRGVCREESAQLMKEFFQIRRREKNGRIV